MLKLFVPFNIKCLTIHYVSKARYFQKTDNPYNSKFGAVSEYFEFHESLVSSTSATKINIKKAIFDSIYMLLTFGL